MVEQVIVSLEEMRGLGVDRPGVLMNLQSAGRVFHARTDPTSWGHLRLVGRGPGQIPSRRRAMRLMSDAFGANGEIPIAYTCEGADRAPALAWEGAPPAAKSFALIVDDPDAPDPEAPKTTWVHWVVYNIPAQTHALPEGGQLPPEAREGLNDWKRRGYGGPCPPVGRHRYFFKLFALDAQLPDLGSPTKAALEKAMDGHVLARAELVGTYQKTR